jgi:hypothetical protein
MLRPFREAWARRQVDETLAWSALATNLFVLPGLGSIMTRRVVAGALQAVLSLAGAGLSLYWLVLLATLWVRAGEFPEAPPSLALGVGGVGIFAFGWLWSLATSLSVIRAVRSGR